MPSEETTRLDDGRPVTVFLSYSREDRPRAEPIIKALESAGFKVWWDGLLVGGVTFARTTEVALESASAVVVLWSKTSIDSHWVRDEATRGRDRGRLVPLSLDGTEPPLGFRQFQVVDVSRWRGNPDAPEIAAVRRAVVAVSGQPEPEARPTTRAPTFRPTRRNVLIAGGSLAVAAIGGAWIAWRKGVFGERIADNSVAVLPFANLSGDPSQNYFSDGLAAEVRAALARNSKLRVMAQVSSDAFRDSKDDAVTIATKLGVAVLLDGSVRLHGEAFRIAAELIDGRTGFSRWAQTFDRPIDNIFAVQSEIAGAVVSALAAAAAAEGGTEDADTRTKALSGGTTNVAAYDSYLRGRALYNLDEGESSDRAALAQFDAAIAADPKFASAYAARARSLTVIANQYADAPSTRGLYDAAVQAAETAAALAPDLADAHSTLGFVLFQGRLDTRAARKPFDLSRQLGAGDATVMARFALYCAATGRTAEASQAIARALELDPLNPLIHRSAGTVSYEARRFADVIPPVRQALALNPKLANTRSLMGNALYMLGHYSEARDAYRAETHDMGRLTGLAIVEKKLGNEAAAQAAMKQLVADLGDTALYQQAQVLAQWGDRAAAMTALERARALGDSGLVYARADPLLDPLRPVPGFLQLLRLLGFD